MKSKNRNLRIMHGCVLGWVGLFAGVAATLPIAMARVSQTEKFAQQPFNSLDCQGKRPSERVVITVEQCLQMKAEPVQAHR